MRRQRLGTSELSISAIGYGAWAAGGPNWRMGVGPQDDRDSIAAIHRAVEIGVNWIDTAPVYGDGHSEEVVGQAIRGLPPSDRPHVFTKCGPGGLQTTVSPDTIRPQLEASLRRLGVEQVDLYQIHWPHPFGSALADAWGVLLDLKREGKFRYAGVSNFSVEQLQMCQARGHVDSSQPPLSAINRAAAESVLPWCRVNGTGVIVYSPMGTGLLTGAFSEPRVAALPANDARRRMPEFQQPRLGRNLAVAAALAEVARRHGVPTPAAAVACALAWPGVTGAIVGARRPRQVDDWSAAGSLVLGADDFATVAAAIDKSGAGQGPARPDVPPSSPSPTTRKDLWRPSAGSHDASALAPFMCDLRRTCGTRSSGGSSQTLDLRRHRSGWPAVQRWDRRCETPRS